MFVLQMDHESNTGKDKDMELNSFTIPMKVINATQQDSTLGDGNLEVEKNLKDTNKKVQKVE